MLSTITWKTSPDHFSPREKIVSLLTEGLVEKGVEVTLFATSDSRTSGRLVAVCPRGHGEDRSLDPRLWESMHLSGLFEHGDEFDLIHDHFGWPAMTYGAMTSTPIVTTLHDELRPEVIPFYRKYAGRVRYVAVSDAARSPALPYAAVIRRPSWMSKKRSAIPGASVFFKVSFTLS